MRSPFGQLGVALCVVAGAFGAPGAPCASAQGNAANADAPASAPSRPAPAAGKVAVVVAGDPDAQLRKAAADVDEAAQHAGLETPADTGLVHALWGEPPSTPNDGLEEARAERRRLGWGEDRDVPVLTRIGRMTGATLMLVVRRGSKGPELVGFDVPAHAFFEGALPLPADPQAVAQFAVARAHATAIGPASVASPRAPPASARAEPTASPAPAKGPKPKPKAKRKKSWIGTNWPYVVAGVLLAGTVAYFVARRHHDQSATPVLRFQLGGNQ